MEDWRKVFTLGDPINVYDGDTAVSDTGTACKSERDGNVCSNQPDAQPIDPRVPATHCRHFGPRSPW